MYVCTPQLAGGNTLVGPNSFKTLDEGPRLVPLKREFPLLIVPTPEGWKVEYTLASRMQIHESLTVLALLTKGEARTSDPWICRPMDLQSDALPPELSDHMPVGPMAFYVASLDVVRPISWSSHADYKYTK